MSFAGELYATASGNMAYAAKGPNGCDIYTDFLGSNLLESRGHNIENALKKVKKDINPISED